MTTTLLLLAALAAAPASTGQSARRHAPTGLGIACRTPGVLARSVVIYDQVELALQADDWEAAMAALGPADPQAAEWLSILCTAHDVAARQRLSLRARATMPKPALTQAELLRDHAEAFLAAHAVAPMPATRDDEKVPARLPRVETGDCPWNCEPAVLTTIPPKPACLCIDGMVIVRAAKKAPK